MEKPWEIHGKSMATMERIIIGDSLVKLDTRKMILDSWRLGFTGQREREPPKASQVNGDLRGPIYKQQWLTIIQLH